MDDPAEASFGLERCRKDSRFDKIGHRMDRLICAWVLSCSGVLHPAERLAFQDDPGASTPFEVIRDFHPTTLRLAVLGAKLDFRVSLITRDGNAADIHVSRAHIERADRCRVPQDSRANGVVVTGLLCRRSSRVARPPILGPLWRAS